MEPADQPRRPNIERLTAPIQWRPALQVGDAGYPITWRLPQPRVGAIYALGEGRTLLRASYSRFVGSLDSDTVFALNTFREIATLEYFWNDANGWGTALLVWTILVGALDNILRPLLIRKGADLPLLLIFAGVIGGLLAFGIIGLFVGPVVLAVGYTLLNEWMSERA